MCVVSQRQAGAVVDAVRPRGYFWREQTTKAPGLNKQRHAPCPECHCFWKTAALGWLYQRSHSTELLRSESLPMI